MQLVHRFANAPRESDGGTALGPQKWIETGAGARLRLWRRPRRRVFVRSRSMAGRWTTCVSTRTEKALADPFCYRDERTLKAERRGTEVISPEQLRELTGVQLMRINTLYQLYADAMQELIRG